MILREHVRACVRACVPACVCLHGYATTYECMRVRIGIFERMMMRKIYVCVQVAIVRSDTDSPPVCSRVRAWVYVRVCACMRVRMPVRMRVWVHGVRMYVPQFPKRGVSGPSRFDT